MTTPVDAHDWRNHSSHPHHHEGDETVWDRTTDPVDAAREALAIAMSVVEHRTMAHIGLGDGKPEAGPQTLRDSAAILASLERDGWTLIRAEERERVDVERLTRALYAIHSWPVGTAESEARDIAAEYAALSDAAGDEP